MGRLPAMTTASCRSPFMKRCLLVPPRRILNRRSRGIPAQALFSVARQLRQQLKDIENNILPAEGLDKSLITQEGLNKLHLLEELPLTIAELEAEAEKLREVSGVQQDLVVSLKDNVSDAKAETANYVIKYLQSKAANHARGLYDELLEVGREKCGIPDDVSKQDTWRMILNHQGPQKALADRLRSCLRKKPIEWSGTFAYVNLTNIHRTLSQRVHDAPKLSELQRRGGTIYLEKGQMDQAQANAFVCLGLILGGLTIVIVDTVYEHDVVLDDFRKSGV